MPASAQTLPEAPEVPGSNLFPDEIMEALTDEERKHALYTGARCPKQKREAIITLLAEGRAIDYIRRLVAVHRETVLNVANSYSAEIADYERRMPAKLKRTKWALVDRIEREVDAIPRQALGLTLKIVSDIEALDSGRAIARVDHVHRVDLFSDFGAFVRELEARPAPIDQKNGAADATAGEVIHSCGEKKPLMLEAPADSAGAPGPNPVFDLESDVLPLPTQHGAPHSPTFSPIAPEETTIHTADGGGGGSRVASPTEHAKDNATQKFLDNGI